MPKLPVIEGLIKRRLLLNFRADPEVVQRLLPRPMRPKLHEGFAIVGICLIRLEQIRPAFVPLRIGASSENAAHRIAVTWEDNDGPHEGVFIPRRDTNSMINTLAGGRLFPGEHHRARFEVSEGLRGIELEMQSQDREAYLSVSGKRSSSLPSESCFASLHESSEFFEGGCLGYSATRDPSRLDGVRLETTGWQVHPLEVAHVRSSYFENADRFPTGSLVFDHGLVMRNIPHRWHGESAMRVDPAPASA